MFSPIFSLLLPILLLSLLFVCFVVALNNGTFQYIPTIWSINYRLHMRKYITLHLTLGVAQCVFWFFGFFF